MTKKPTARKPKSKALKTPVGSPLRIGVLGASGRMGQRVCHLVSSEFVPDKKTGGSSAVLGPCGSKGDGLLPLILESDVIIDFSSPEGVLDLQKQALDALRSGRIKKLPALVTGTTGWANRDPRVALAPYAAKARILTASNFSTGVLALLQVLRTSAPLFKRLGYTPVLVETHHCHKKDAPSGTAISMRRALAPSFGDDEGTGSSDKGIQTLSIRAGEVIGEHELRYYSASDEIWIGHRAQDRDLFARGAIQVAIWLASLSTPSVGWVPIDDFLA